METKVFTQFNPQPRVLEKGGGHLEVERVGYVPAAEMIKGMLETGKSLMLARSAQYDTKPGSHDIPDIDPMRRPGIDPAEISQIAYNLDERLQNARKKAQELAEARQKQQAEEEATRQKKLAEEEPELPLEPRP